jgi:hypothetical protein
MTATTTHRLEGLEPDNLLAFLTLLGLLRALETGAPDWRPRVHWNGPPLRPVLTLAEAATQEKIAEAAARGCAKLAKDYEFGGDADLTFDKARGRALLEAAATPGTRARAAVLDSLFSDGALKEDGRVLASPLCAMFGQGHQHFLTRLSDVPRGVLPKTLAKKKAPPDLNTPSRIEEALFTPWTRRDETDSFRWDPAEDRRYALRFRNPSNDAGCTVHGANRLATVGLATLPGAAVERRGRIRFLTLGADLNVGGGVEITWPIWENSASLAAIQALIAHPALATMNPDRNCLARFGVIEVRRTSRISVGKFFNFTRAEAM